MRSPIITLLLLAGLALPARAQNITWAEHVAPILYTQCATCHHPGGIGPFSLITYQEAKDFAYPMQAAILSKHMPPWPPNPDYSRLAHERLLSPTEIQTILEWVDAPLQGDPALAPEVPDFSDGGFSTGDPDMILKIPVYTLNSNEDDYQCFVLSPNLSEDKFIARWELVPGNRNVVHHADAYLTTNDNCINQDTTNGEPGFDCSCNYYQKTFFNWSPNGDPSQYPPNLGVRLPAGNDIVLEIHYAPNYQGAQDSTEIWLYFADDTSQIREVFPSSWTGSLQNPPFAIPADTVITFYNQRNFNNDTLSLLRTSPHMHLLGVYMESFLVLPEGDTVPVIQIPKWDFHWQGYYTFPSPFIVPPGSVMYNVFTYDNTVNNPYNPVYPPVETTWGPTTIDEMMIHFVEYMRYEPGDENLVFDSVLVDLSPLSRVVDLDLNNQTRLEDIYPNPAGGAFTIPFYLDGAQEMELYVNDLTGRQIQTILSRNFLPGGAHALTVNQPLPPGLYLVQMISEKGGKQVRRVRVF